jgi:metal-responsive CopG/Arc/MetJ family transcriptional regulator
VPRKNGSGKSPVSFSLSADLEDILEASCEILNFDNRSTLVEHALRDYIMRKLGANPIIWKKVCREIREFSK